MFVVYTVLLVCILGMELSHEHQLSISCLDQPVDGYYHTEQAR